MPPTNFAAAPFSSLVIGNLENRRIQFFQAALQRLGLPPARELAYLDLLEQRERLAEIIQAHQPKLVRIESPGENFEVERQLIALGAERAAEDRSMHIDAAAAMSLDPDHGAIRFPRQWFCGFSFLLESISNTLAQFPDVALQNATADIRLMFDKSECQSWFADQGIAVPEIVHGVHDFDELRKFLVEHDWNRVFVKLAHGSSSSGVIALYRSAAKWRAVTSMQMVQEGDDKRFYNRLKLSVYRDERQIAQLIDFVCREHAQIERWLPRAAVAGVPFDLRVVVIEAQPAQIVVRQSHKPMTNLHLGNRRGDLAAVRAASGDRWHEVMDLCTRTARLFPKCNYLGLDVLQQSGFRQPVILEANAFGDLLPGIVDDQHRDTYSAELESFRRKVSMAWPTVG